MTDNPEEGAGAPARRQAEDTGRIIRFLIGKALLFMLFPAVLAALAVFFLI
ncbi:phosphoribosylformylglycinamidine synthase-associated small membrane protein [Breoghania sp. JC706]|uniref:phosphoribosylformylglycinamidine synthase-associated small membrane protein n=1 Tax=Breoghania sp. JC706 TaxID=3117732 RepID=UPI00300AC052